MSNFDGVLDPASGWPDIPQASTSMVVLGGAGGPLNEQATQLTARTKKLKEDIENISPVGFGGQYRKLRITIPGVGYTGTITAERLVVESATFSTSVLRNINLSFNAAVQGINGLDTGSVQASTWYYIYVIYNSSDVSSIISASSTSPAMPAGYTKLAMIGAARSTTDGKFLQSTQVDSDLIYMASLSTQAFTQVLNDGSAIAPTPFSVASCVPPIAKSCLVNCNVPGTSQATGFLLVGGLASYTYDAIGKGLSKISIVDLPFGTNVYYKCEFAGGSMSNYVIGYKL